MVRKNDQEQRLLAMLNSSANRNCCGECKTHNPTWASWNLGIFLCGRCASAHRSLGRDISRVKSLSMEQWSFRELSTLERIGNKANNQFWNDKGIPFPFDPEDKDALVMWLRNKYTGKYKTGALRNDDYNLSDQLRDDEDTTDDWGYEKSRDSQRGYGVTNIASTGLTRSMRRGQQNFNNYFTDDDYYNKPLPSKRDNSYSNSSSRGSTADPESARLSFRHPTNLEMKKYGDQCRKMKFDMGYENEDVNVEALVLARGNIQKAVAIINRSGVGASKGGYNTPPTSYSESSVPALPRRRETAGAIFNSAKAGGFDWLGDGDMNTNAIQNDVNTGNTGTQIYQYVDPNSGAIYYIDSNGQQYADPNSSQQQMMTPMQIQQAQMQMQPNYNGQMMPTQNTMMTGVQQMQQQQQQQLLQQQQQQFLQQQMLQSQQGSNERAPTLNELQQQQQLQQMQLQSNQGMVYNGQQQNYFPGF